MFCAVAHTVLMWHPNCINFVPRAMKKETKFPSPNEVSSLDLNLVTARAIRFLKEYFSPRSWTSRRLSIGLEGLRLVLKLAILLSGSATLACFAQTVTVRIVNAADGKPVAAKEVLISGIKGNGETRDEARRKLVRKHTSPDLTLVTDARGRVQFDLPNAPPAEFYVRAVLRPPVWDCTCLVTVPTEELMRKGFWVGAHNDSSVQAQHGEILFRIRPTALWVRVFWPFLVDRPF